MNTEIVKHVAEAIQQADAELWNNRPRDPYDPYFKLAQAAIKAFIQAIEIPQQKQP